MSHLPAFSRSVPARSRVAGKDRRIEEKKINSEWRVLSILRSCDPGESWRAPCAGQDGERSPYRFWSEHHSHCGIHAIHARARCIPQHDRHRRTVGPQIRTAVYISSLRHRTPPALSSGYRHAAAPPGTPEVPGRAERLGAKV